MIDGVSRACIDEESCIGGRTTWNGDSALNKGHAILEGKRKAARVLKWMECLRGCKRDLARHIVCAHDKFLEEVVAENPVNRVAHIRFNRRQVHRSRRSDRDVQSSESKVKSSPDDLDRIRSGTRTLPLCAALKMQPKSSCPAQIDQAIGRAAVEDKPERLGAVDAHVQENHVVRGFKRNHGDLVVRSYPADFQLLLRFRLALADFRNCNRAKK